MPEMIEQGENSVVKQSLTTAEMIDQARAILEDYGTNCAFDDCKNDLLLALLEEREWFPHPDRGCLCGRCESGRKARAALAEFVEACR